MSSKYSKWRTYPSVPYILNGEFHITHSNRQPQVSFHEYDPKTDTVNMQALMGPDDLIRYLSTHYTLKKAQVQSSLRGMYQRISKRPERTKLTITTFMSEDEVHGHVYHLDDPEGRFAKTFWTDKALETPIEFKHAQNIHHRKVDISNQYRQIDVGREINTLFKMVGVNMNNGFTKLRRLIKEQNRLRKKR